MESSTKFVRAVERPAWLAKLTEFKDAVLYLLRRKSFYVGLLAIVAGRQLNYLSQTWLHHYVQSGHDLPQLPDLLLENIPYWDIDYIYDSFLLVGAFFFILYLVHKRQYKRIPYIMLVGGMYHSLRALFIILTPLGNPTLFDGTGGLFNGFARYELGMYPSGHTGIVTFFVLFTHHKVYRSILIFCMLMVIIAMFLARGHYSIDILSAVLFAYAIKAFSDKFLRSRMLGPDYVPPVSQ